MIDHDSIVRQGAVVRVWRKATYDTPIEISTSVGKTKTQLLLSLVEIQCANRTEKVLEGRAFLDNRLDGMSVEIPQLRGEPTFISPESTSENVMKTVCAVK